MIQAVKASKESGKKYNIFENGLLFTSIINLGERPQPTCKDCKEIGHYNKNTINASFLKRTKLMMVSKT